MKQKKIYIYGKHSVTEALTHAPHIVRSIALSPQMEDRGLKDLIRARGVPTEKIDERKATSQVEGNAPHQGVIALISLTELVVPFEKFFDTFNPTSDTCLVLLSDVQDPHNVGAIIRSAAAFGATAVLMPTHHQAPVTGVVIKTSAGMAFRLPLVTMDNMQQAIAEIKKKGVKVYGLTGDGKTSLDTETFTTPTLFVFGNEGEGIAPAAKVLCDTMLSIPIHPRTESLNVAASAAVVLHAWSTQHSGAIKG